MWPSHRSFNSLPSSCIAVVPLFLCRTLATEPILLSCSAGTKLISLIFANQFPHLLQSPVGPTTSEVRFPYLNINSGVTEHYYNIAMFATPLTLVWFEAAGSCHGASWMTMRGPLVYLMVANKLGFPMGHLPYPVPSSDRPLVSSVAYLFPTLLYNQAHSKLGSLLPCRCGIKVPDYMVP